MPLRGWAGVVATTPCARAKCPYTVVEDCSKLRSMQKRAANHDAERPHATNRLTEASRDQTASQELGEADRETRRLGQRYTVKEAAESLGTTVDAVRGRIRRGTLASAKLDGVVYVLLDETNHERRSDESATTADDAIQQNADQSDLVGELRVQIDWLRREVERKDTIIMQMAQRIPELEPPAGPRDATETTSEGKDRREVPSEQHEPTQRRSWLYRFFFGP